VIRESIERLAELLGGAETRHGVLARAALGRPLANDAEQAHRLAAALGAQLRADGSMGGAMVPTVWRAHELMDLEARCGIACGRAIGWILGRQGRPGGFGEGCDRIRHARRVCRHYVGGFFAPAPSEQRCAPVTLPNGKVFRAEPAARFAISCLALRAVLRAGAEARPMVRQHLLSLEQIADTTGGWGDYFAPDVLMSALHALAVGGKPYQPTVARLVELVAAHQAPDGGWANADLFVVLDALLAVGTDESRAVVRKAVPALVARQRADGTFGVVAQQERALIGLRALVWAEELTYEERAAP
jgi:hypothetical protein